METGLNCARKVTKGTDILGPDQLSELVGRVEHDLGAVHARPAQPGVQLAQSTQLLETGVLNLYNLFLSHVLKIYEYKSV